ncbi:hypothetical protein SERLADRAFT_379958, partial [Serpula lacrymans var. lacrymans S7.9]
MYNKQPYHMSSLTGEELIDGHPDHIRSELRVSLQVFEKLAETLRDTGIQGSKYISLNKKLAIFLYASVTGLSTQHLGERFQRSNNTIS